MLYYSADVSGPQTLLKVVSPVFEPNTLPTCAIQFALHMFRMDFSTFKMVIKAPNSTWESTTFEGNSAHKWENQTQPINVVTQPFRVILEIINPGSGYPSHVAIDNIRAINCYHKRKTITDCTPRQFQCDDLICVDAAQVCDISEDCIDGEDEDYECDKIPESAFCTFEKDMCGWNTSTTENSEWLRRSGMSPNARTGPSSDHTFQNSTGTYLVAKFPPGRSFGLQTTLTSPWFMPPPYYHRNVHSAFYNSCQVRFFFHKFGNGVGELRLYSLESVQPPYNNKEVELWRSYGNKGDTWWKAVVNLPNMTKSFQLQFVARRGVGNSDIAIDDITLSRECFGIGVPENESIIPEEPSKPNDQKPQVVQVKKYVINTCGAVGRLGPNENQCAIAYQNTTTKINVLTEPTLEGIQRWIVPESGLYTVFVKGAGGGPGVENRGRSLGASLRATFDWEEGELIYILVGQKGIDACGTESSFYLQRACETGIMKRSIEGLRALNKERRDGGGGGGGGATYVFKTDRINQQRVPLAVAGGGGGLSAKLSRDETFVNTIPHGLMPNNSILPINGYTGPGAGGGGGWDDNTNTPTGGESLREGGRGGRVCQRSSVWGTHGGFGGGGGGCASGGGGGGYRGGDASEVENAYYNGQGGTSYLVPGTIRALIEPGSNPGDGYVVIVPAQSGCGCDYLCVYLDLDNMAHYCICPPHLTINIDGYSCNGHPGVSVSPKMLVIIILSIVLAVSILIVCIFFATAKYRKMQRSRDVSNQPLNSPDEQLSRLRSGVAGGMVSENNPNYEFGGNTFSERDLKTIARENITLLHALGQGAFGEVYQGTLKVGDNDLPVAVKTLPEMSSNQAIFDFLMEALIMSKFNHPNIVSFIGVCFEKMPRFIVLELLPGGDLKMFLRECRPKPNKPAPLTVTDLLKLATDVAKGCQYLEENHFIHRDIAARNCLLTTKGADRVVKIADFGMARDIYRYHIMMQCWHPHPDERPNFATIIERLGYCMQDPDVINAALPVFQRAPSMERDTTVMRPMEEDSANCLQVQRPDPGLLLSPGSEDYLIPTPHSSYSLNTEIMSSPSRNSNDQFLEMEERGSTSSTRPTVSETNFMTPDTPTEPQWTNPNEGAKNSNRTPMKKMGAYTEVPTEDTDGEIMNDKRKNPQPNGMVATGNSNKQINRMSSIKSLDDLPMAPPVCENENQQKNNPNSTTHKSNLSLDPSALVQQISGDNRPPTRYISVAGDVDVNCNTGNSNSSLNSRTGFENQNRVSGPFDGYSGVNPVA
ncbi:ALK tyrosine kinase receptor [Nephila pilipes]|uniref:ALK tyrosine kinase receptor n=1 Tax=Nephila pilipes TaxID=299642 RepID=A0A8X6IMZ3_NEPPI|nr:ALK tyrosine kinase receptor [Nephila pilipes]